jgi:hypothetical protein
MDKVLGRPKFGNGDRENLRAALDGGKSWHAVTNKTRIPWKHARALGYDRRGILTARGGQWYATTVKNLLDRVAG